MPELEQDVVDRVIGMLMHLWSLVTSAEIRAAIQSTIDELGRAR